MRSPNWIIDRLPPEEGFYLTSLLGEQGRVRHFDGRCWSSENAHPDTFNEDDARLLVASDHPTPNAPLRWVIGVEVCPHVESKVTDGWIDWQGGERPMAPDSIVETRLRNGSVGRTAAEAMDWTHSQCAGDIVGYRIVGERRHPEPDPSWYVKQWGCGERRRTGMEPSLAAPHGDAPHSHYFRSVKGLDQIDVYRVLQLFEVTDPCLQHAIKKLLVPGKRGAGKDIARDVREAVDTLKRWQEMQQEVTRCAV